MAKENPLDVKQQCSSEAVAEEPVMTAHYMNPDGHCTVVISHVPFEDYTPKQAVVVLVSIVSAVGN